MAKKRNNQYWINRSEELLANIHQQSTPYILDINKYYDKALKDLQKDINHIFNTYQAGHGLSRARAKRILNSKIPNFIRDIIKRIYPRLKDGKIKSWMLAELNSQAYRARITRLEALKKAIQVHYMSVADEQLTLSKMAYINTLKESYYRTAYNLQKGINVGFYLTQIPEHTIKAVLNTNWSGKLYSERIWSNSQATIDAIAETLISGFISGKSVPRMVKELEELTGHGKYAAERLIRTETTFFANQGSILSYKECGIEKYIFVATLDLRTSNQCRKHDRKVYEVSKAMPGENLPPLHVFCRSTTRAYLGEKYMENVQRRARDPITGKTYLVGNISYEEWYKQYVQ